MMYLAQVRERALIHLRKRKVSLCAAADPLVFCVQYGTGVRIILVPFRVFKSIPCMRISACLALMASTMCEY